MGSERTPLTNTEGVVQGDKREMVRIRLHPRVDVEGFGTDLLQRLCR